MQGSELKNSFTKYVIRVSLKKYWIHFIIYQFTYKKYEKKFQLHGVIIVKKYFAKPY